MKLVDAAATLGLDPTGSYSSSEVKRAFRESIKKAHPDVGGSAAQAQAVYDAAALLKFGYTPPTPVSFSTPDPPPTASSPSSSSFGFSSPTSESASSSADTASEGEVDPSSVSWWSRFVAGFGFKSRTTVRYADGSTGIRPGLLYLAVFFPAWFFKVLFWETPVVFRPWYSSRVRSAGFNVGFVVGFLGLLSTGAAASWWLVSLSASGGFSVLLVAAGWWLVFGVFAMLVLGVSRLFRSPAGFAKPEFVASVTLFLVFGFVAAGFVVVSVVVFIVFLVSRLVDWLFGLLMR